MSELICPDMGAAGGCKRSTPPHQATPAQLPRILPLPLNTMGLPLSRTKFCRCLCTQIYYQNIRDWLHSSPESLWQAWEICVSILVELNVEVTVMSVKCLDVEVVIMWCKKKKKTLVDVERCTPSYRIRWQTSFSSFAKMITGHMGDPRSDWARVPKTEFEGSRSWCTTAWSPRV